jgi:hypothetical protein
MCIVEWTSLTMLRYVTHWAHLDLVIEGVAVQILTQRVGKHTMVFRST